jgi:hypothetical protein
MSLTEWAQKFDGREYGKEITKQEEADLKADGFVAVFGCSDDNLEFRGAIDDEFGCYDGGTALIVDGGLLEECDSGCKYYAAAVALAKRIVAHWSSQGYSWYIESPDLEVYGVFDILEDGEKYCRGIVFDSRSARGWPD